MLQRPIGIFGGTFNPVHNGHLYIAEEALKMLPLSVIKFVPCYLPVHRQIPEISPFHREAMLSIALKNYPRLEIDRRELMRQEPSYMIDTLISLRNELPNTPLCLILGNDAYMHIETWKSWQELLNYCHFVVINRSGFEKKMASGLQSAEITNKVLLAKEKAGAIYFLKLAPCPISATQIRQKLKQHEDVTTLIPLEVAEYIKTHQLYL